MSSCPVKIELEELIAGRLTAPRHEFLDRHVQGCATCQSVLETLEEPRDDYCCAVNELARLATDFAERPFRHAIRRLKSLKEIRPDDLQFASETGGPLAVDGVLGDFRIVRQVGRGGMGIVYEAQQISLARRVALKILPFAALLEPRRLQRFQNEARAAASLEHPHIVPVYAVGSDRGVYYYAMRYIDGLNLAAIVAELGKRTSLAPVAGGRAASTLTVSKIAEETARLADESTHSVPNADSLANWPAAHGLPHFQKAVRLVIDAARALDYAHERGVVHRDIKPSNLMLDNEGIIWIADFGLARIEADPTFSATGEVLGTLRYMSPEQALGRRGVVDHRSDIYSLGVTLYELLTLTPVFPDVPDHAVLAKIASEDPTPPRWLNPLIPVPLETVVQRAMSKDAADRFATAGEFADDLQRFLDQKRVKSPRPGIADRSAKWVRKHPTTLVFAAILLVLLAGFGIVQSIQSNERGTLIAQLNDAAVKSDKLNGDLLTALSASRTSERHAQDLLYAGDMGLAAKAVEQDDLSGALNILRRWETPTDGIDRRGFEWKWLCHKCKPEGASIRVSAAKLSQVSLSPDGRSAALACEDGNIYVYDTANWHEQKRIATGQRELTSLDFFPDGTRLASAAWDGTVCVWDFKTGRQLFRFRPHKDVCKCVAVTHDGGCLITSGSDANNRAAVRIWSAEDGKSLGTLFEHTDRAGRLCVSVDGSLLAAGTQNDQIRIWSLTSRSLLHTLTGHQGRVNQIAFISEGKKLLSASGDATLREWNLEKGGHRVIGKHLEAIDCLAVGADERSVAAGDRGGMVCIWSLDPTQTDFGRSQSTKLFSRASHRGRVESLRFTKDETQLVSAGDDGCLAVTAPYAFGSVRQISIPGWRSIFTGFRLADDGSAYYWCDEEPAEPKFAAAIRRDGSATAWTERHDADEIHLRARAGEPEDVPLDLDLPPDVTVEWINFVADTPLLLVRTFGDGHDLRVYDVTKRRRVYEEFSPAADRVALSRDGKRIAFERGKIVTVADFPNTACRIVLRGHPESVETIALNNDGSVLVTGSGDRSIRLWNTETGTLLHVLEDHRATVCALAVSADGKTLASGDLAGFIKLWHLPSGKPFYDLPRAGDRCCELALSADGSRLVCRYANNELFEFLTRRETPPKRVISCQAFPER